MDRRTFISTVGASGIAALAGCLDAVPGMKPRRYTGTADALVLDVDEIPSREWEVHVERDPNFEPHTMEDGHAVEFIEPGSEESGLVIAIIVFESIDAIQAFYRDQRFLYAEEGYEVRDEAIGDGAHSAGNEQIAYFEILEANVWMQVYGTLHLIEVRGTAEAQYDRARTADGWA